MFYIVLTIRIKTLHQKSAIIINNNNNNNSSRKKEGKTHRLDRVILFISMERPNTSLGGLNTNIVTPSLCKKIKSKTSVVEMKNLDKKH
jgi:hypothetical protein